MSDLGSFHNNLYANGISKDPEVGDGATELGWTDRHPYTVVEVISPKKVVVQADKAIRTDKNGMSDSQSYTFERNEEGRKVTITKRKNGTWKAIGSEGNPYMIGRRMAYHDYSF